MHHRGDEDDDDDDDDYDDSDGDDDDDNADDDDDDHDDHDDRHRVNRPGFERIRLGTTSARQVGNPSRRAERFWTRICGSWTIRRRGKSSDWTWIQGNPAGEQIREETNFDSW